MAPSPSLVFESDLRVAPEAASWTVFDVSDSEAVFGTRQHVRVHGAVDEVPVEIILMPHQERTCRTGEGGDAQGARRAGRGPRPRTYRGGGRMNALETAAGDRVVFDRYGPAGAPAVLFLTGAGPTRADDPVTTETARQIAARGFQASVHDRIGRGDSQATGHIALDRELDAIIAIAAELDAPVVLVGHSSGCAIAIQAASRIERLVAVVLWEAPFGQFEEGAPQWWTSVLDSIERGELEEAVTKYMVDMPPEWLDELRASPTYPEVVLSWIPDGTALARVESDGLPAALRDIGVPVLALIGTDTFPGMAEAAAEIADAAPDGSHEELRGAWHSWDPEAFAARLAEMLASAPA